MTRNLILALIGVGLIAAANPASAQQNSEPSDAGNRRGTKEFIGVDLDNGGVYYNGCNSGRYCLYRTVEVFNRYTGYVEPRRVRRCGHGLYLP